MGSRCDVMVLPRAAGQPGVVLELKAIDVHQLAVAFDGKRAWVQAAP